MTIRLRLAVLFMVGTLVMLIGSGVVFVGRLEGSLEKNIDSTLGARARDISSSIAARAGRAARSEGHAVPVRLGTVNGVYAQLLTASGRVLDSSRAVADASLISPSQARAAMANTVITDRVVSLATTNEAKNEEPLRILARRSGQNGIVVVVATNRDVVDNATAQARTQLVVLSSIVLLLAGTGSWLLTRAALRPVEKLRIEAGGLHDRNAGAGLQVPDTRDEIARLAQTFNGLLSHLQRAVSRERAFVADAGHELRTPLTVLTGELELARRPGRSREELVDTIDVAAEETERLVRLTDDLLLIGRDSDTGVIRHDRFDVAGMANAAIRATASATSKRGIAVAEVSATPVWAHGNVDRMRRAVDNLLTNAIRFSPDGSPVTVTVGVDRQSAWIRVADEGPGFPPDFLPVAFNRFTRADDARTRSGNSDSFRDGSGLGLAVVRAVMTSHGGTVEAHNRPGGGAEVVLTWAFDETDDEPPPELSRNSAGVPAPMQSSGPAQETCRSRA